MTIKNKLAELFDNEATLTKLDELDSKYENWFVEVSKLGPLDDEKQGEPLLSREERKKYIELERSKVPEFLKTIGKEFNKKAKGKEDRRFSDEFVAAFFGEDE